MAAYVIFDIVSVHPDRMTGYGEKAVASLEAFGGKIVAASNEIDACGGTGIRSGLRSSSSLPWRRHETGTIRPSIKRCSRSGSRRIVTRW